MKQLHEHLSKKCFYFSTHDGENIFVTKWFKEEKQKPKALLQIAHGMAEHIERYESLAEFLVKHNFIVYGNDHRGHGRTAKESNKIGFFAEKNGFNAVVDDMFQLTQIMKREYPNIPIILLGHSMGSFLARKYIQLYGEELFGLILSGTGGDPGILGVVGKSIARFEVLRKGKREKSKLMDRLSFGQFNRSFRPNRTPFDWLNRDDAEVDKYIADPYCGGVFTAGFFYDLLSGILEVNDPHLIQKVPKALPIYLFSGERDPVGNQTKGVLQTVQAFREAGIEDVTYKFYQEGRHEMLLEVNREEVFEDMLKWIEEKIGIRN